MVRVGYLVPVKELSGVMERRQRQKKGEAAKQVTKVYKLKKRNPRGKQDASSSSSSSNGKDIPAEDASAAVGIAGSGGGGGRDGDGGNGADSAEVRHDIADNNNGVGESVFRLPSVHKYGGELFDFWIVEMPNRKIPPCPRWSHADGILYLVYIIAYRYNK